MTEEQLLREFAAKGSDEAFHELVRRYGGLVYSACLRRLGNPHDAEDATQAVFLTLARKAGKVRGRALAAWLHQVARFVSARAVRNRTLRNRREKEAAAMSEPVSEKEAERAWGEVRPALDQAVASMPAAQREVLVMHYLAGRSISEVAECTGRPVGSIKSTLSRALDKLRLRLGKSAGVKLSSAVLAAALGRHAVESMPIGLLNSAAAMAGGGAASATAATLADGAVKSLALAKIKALVLSVGIAAALGGGGGLAVSRVSRHLEDVRRFGPFAPDPAVTRILESLDSGQSALLPPTRITGELNAVARRFKMNRTGPRGRDFGNTAVWMPDRKRAIYLGANKRTPHHVNDVWEYDLAANTWICLYGPDIETGWRLKDPGKLEGKLISSDGVMRHVRGGPVIHGQGWQHLVYDPGIGAALFMNVWSPHGEIEKHYVREFGHKHRPPLWKFDPRERKWEPLSTGGSPPVVTVGAYYAYVPALKRSLWHCNVNEGSGVWAYDSTGKKWSARGEVRTRYGRLSSDMPAYNGVMTHCPDRGLLLVCASGRQSGAGRTWHYGIDSGKWELTVDGPESPVGSPRTCVMRYDPVSQRALLFDRRDGIRRLMEYDPDARKWQALDPEGPAIPEKRRPVVYHDVARNVFVINYGTTTWVYRHTRRRK